MTRALTEIDEAGRRVLEHCQALEAEVVPLECLVGRILAEDIVSNEAVPAFANSAMDGFAVRAADTAGASDASPVTLSVVDESRAGTPAERTVNAGEAVLISTGAAVPDGADAIVRIEDAGEAGRHVSIRAEVSTGESIRRPGEDVRVGERVLRTGTKIGPAELGLLVAVGRSYARCTMKPRVAVLTTGDELLEPSKPVGLGGVRDSNRYSLPALAEEAGAEVVVTRSLPDDPVATKNGIETVLDADLVVICGGVSVGRHDHVRPALAALGVREIFWGVALRPGKPTWFGAQRHDHVQTLVLGLPGNPVSAIVTFTLLARPAIRAMLGASVDGDKTTATLDQPYEKEPGRAHAIRCQLALQSDGWHVRPNGDQGSHVLTSMVGAQALAIIPARKGSVPRGEQVEIVLLD